MENNESQDEQNEVENDFESDDYQPSKFKQWFQDNLRIIISVIIVVFIAGGIYSYSKRAEAPKIEDNSEQSSVLDNLQSDSAATDSKNQDIASTENKDQTSKKDESQKNPTDSNVKSQKTASSVATSQETDKSFVETSGKGDSQTKLARRALANYLEKNTDSSLTAEHKIYIEDYLRKQAAHQGQTTIGTSVEFSKDSIQTAISLSKKLTDSQIKNLHKYAVRVPSLS